MTFFNKKEEVLDIQLTQFGKQLLSIGKFKPVYYAFFDSNILYDGAHGEITEVQNDIEGRIQEDTAQLKTQHAFSGRARDYPYVPPQITTGKGNSLTKTTARDEFDAIRIQSTPEKHFSLVNPLGDSDLQSSRAPNWKIVFLDGEYANTASFYLSSSNDSVPEHPANPDLQIPQISMNVTYTAKVLTPADIAEEQANIEILNQFNVKNDVEPDPIESSITFQDGSRVDINFKDDNRDLLLMVEENGVTFEKENFEIEVYIVEPSDGTYTPLFFKEEPTNVVDGLLVSETIPEINPDIDDTYVEYYFDINVDSRINKKTICEAISVVKSKGIYVDNPIECEEVISSPTTISPYAEGAKDPTCQDE